MLQMPDTQMHEPAIGDIHLRQLALLLPCNLCYAVVARPVDHVASRLGFIYRRTNTFHESAGLW